jgi:hypothetical protein
VIVPLSRSIWNVPVEFFKRPAVTVPTFVEMADKLPTLREDQYGVVQVVVFVAGL